MNNWHTEFMAEYDRQHILEEAEEIRLANLATHSHLYRPGLFGRTMFYLAVWMISTGNRLRKRYEIPAIHCSQSPTRSFVP
jgi:hypothetical protein